MYPKDLSKDGPKIIGRGRVIPTTSYEAMWSPVVQWMADGEFKPSDTEPDELLNDVLPNKDNTGSLIYNLTDLFEYSGTEFMGKRNDFKKLE